MTGLFRVVVLVLLSSSFFSLPSSATDDDEEFKGLRIGIMKKPTNCPRQSKKGDRITVDYKCTTVDQRTIIDTRELTSTIGEGSMVAAWDLGLLDMCVGEHRELIAPPGYAYGDMPVGDTIPPKATIIFYVTLKKIEDGPEQDEEIRPNTFTDIDINSDGLISHGEAAGWLRRESIPDEVGDLSHENLLVEIFHEEDKNKDGFISHQEFQGLKHSEL